MGILNIGKLKSWYRHFKGITIECNEPPLQHVLLKLKLTLTEAQLLEKELVTLNNKAIISMTIPKQGQIISGVFFIQKGMALTDLFLTLKNLMPWYSITTLKWIPFMG